jgi:hypothetical protein
MTSALVACADASPAEPPEPQRCEDALAHGSPAEGCVRPGIAPDGCAEGFAHDGGYGCVPILPPAPCPAGLMAVPGETECRPIMACGEGKWGEIPVDTSTVYVDAAYLAGDGNGSALKPWPTISDAVSAAPPGALVAIAEGSYYEDVMLGSKTLRIWGICPDKVEVVALGQGTFCPPSALCIIGGATGSEIHGLSLRGDGLVISGSEQLLIDRVKVHDTANRGIVIQDTLGVTSVRIVGSLIEQATELGIYVAGASAEVEASVVRATQLSATSNGGRGINVQLSCSSTSCNPNSRSNAVVRGSLVEQNHYEGIYVMGSDVVVEASVVRGTLPLANGTMGRGIGVSPLCIGAMCDPSVRADVVVQGSVVEQNHDIGVAVFTSDVLVESTVVRDTQREVATGGMGRGITVQLICIASGCYELPAAVTIRGSLVEQNRDVGIFVGGSDARVESTVVRDTRARESDSLFGDGVAAMEWGAPTSVTLTDARIEESARAGVASFGASVTLARTAIACAALDLDGEPFEGNNVEFADQGDNVCGCPQALNACKLVSTELDPPAPLGSSN